MQQVMAVSILVLSLYLQTRFLPFHQDFGDFNSIEIHSIMVSTFIVIAAIFTNDPSTTDIGRVIASTFALVLVISFTIRILISIYFKTVAFCTLALKFRTQPFNLHSVLLSFFNEFDLDGHVQWKQSRKVQFECNPNSLRTLHESQGLSESFIAFLNESTNQTIFVR